jgi:hypothetical protein
MTPLKSLSQPPRQVDGVQPFTIASTQDTSLGCPGPLDTMIGRWTGLSPPPHPAQRERWYASEMSIEKWKSHRLSVLLS